LLHSPGFLPLLAGIFLFISLNLQAQQEWSLDSYLQLSNLYFQEALVQFQQEAWDDARTLVETSLEFSDRNGDSRFLLALLDLQEGQAMEAEERIRDILSNYRLNHFRRTEAHLALMRALHLSADWATVPVVFREDRFLLNSPEALYLLYESYERRNLGEESRSVLRQALDLFPQDKRLLRASLVRFWAEPRVSQQIRLFHANGHSWDSLDLHYIIRRLPQGRQGREILDFLESLDYGEEPQVFVHRILQGLLPQRAISELGRLPLEYDWIYELGRFLTDTEAREAFSNLLFQLNTRVSRDLQSDGFPDETMEMAQGRLVNWIHHVSGMHNESFRIHFLQGTPLYWVIRTGDWELTGRYDHYPYLATLERSRPGGSELIHYGPGTLRLPVIPEYNPDIPSWAIPAGPAQNVLPLDELQNSDSIVSMEEYDERGLLRKRWSFLQGQIYLMEEDSRGLGYRDQTVFYGRGGVDRVFRDSDGDGRFEIMMVREDNNQDYILAETRILGSVDYLSELSPGGFRLWDVDGDRIPDFRYYRLPEDGQLEFTLLESVQVMDYQLPQWESRPWP